MDIAILDLTDLWENKPVINETGDKIKHGIAIKLIWFTNAINECINGSN